MSIAFIRTVCNYVDNPGRRFAAPAYPHNLQRSDVAKVHGAYNAIGRFANSMTLSSAIVKVLDGLDDEATFNDDIPEVVAAVYKWAYEEARREEDGTHMVWLYNMRSGESRLLHVGSFDSSSVVYDKWAARKRCVYMRDTLTGENVRTTFTS